MKAFSRFVVSLAWFGVSVAQAGTTVDLAAEASRPAANDQVQAVVFVEARGANPAVLALKARGLPIMCWTVRSAEAEARARAIADNITFEGYMPAIPAA